MGLVQVKLHLPIFLIFADGKPSTKPLVVFLPEKIRQRIFGCQ